MPFPQLFKLEKFLGYTEKLGEELSNPRNNPDESLMAAFPKTGGQI